MAEKLVATLNVAFNDDDGIGDNAGKNKIVLQQMTKQFNYNGELAARCFPSSGVKFTTSVGNVREGEVRVQPMREALKFSDSSSASLKYSDVTDVVIDSSRSVLMQKTKDIYGKTIIKPATGITLHYDADSGSVIAKSSGHAEVNVYGACFVAYTAKYLVLFYTPTSERIGFTGGISFGLGTIFGYNDYDVATLDMELDLTSSTDWVEFARVTSKIVLDAKGVWEFPENWQSTYDSNRDKVGDLRDDYSTPGQFPGFTDEVDPDNSFVDTRVHHIVEVNTVGTIRHIDHNNGGDDYWAWEQPYFGSSTYNPKYEIKYTDPPGGEKASSAKDFQYDQENTTWRDVFLRVNKTELETDLKKWYPGADKYTRPRP
jgi:hypothetical protein